MSVQIIQLATKDLPAELPEEKLDYPDCCLLYLYSSKNNDMRLSKNLAWRVASIKTVAINRKITVLHKIIE